ncbi:MAG: hypothetical protein CMC11_04250 [Flavobacteriaceae bacterium]|nr:hypothetical protein [Flavobacteriaceae bacterium]
MYPLSFNNSIIFVLPPPGLPLITTLLILFNVKIINHYIYTKVPINMSSEISSKEFYSRFYDQLVISQDWPGKYLFKFIVKSESPHLKVLKTYFKSTNAIISEKKSSKKSFTSLSVKVEMKTPEDVIKIYKKSSKLEGVIAL